MEENNPYNNWDVVRQYEARYLHHPNVSDETDFEIHTIKSVLSSEDYKSWCDVACGTGFHLRYTPSKKDITRVGVDRSQMMMDVHAREYHYKVDFVCDDVLQYEPDRKFDLVTNFWFGYSHQETLEAVGMFFDKMIDITAPGGSIILSFHNQWKIFDKIPLHDDEPMGGFFSFDAMVWSYEEPAAPGCVYQCVVPHKQLIINHFRPFFGSANLIQYPEGSGPGGREILYLKNKL